MTDLPPEMLDRIHHGDSLAWLRSLPAECVDLVLTSPPYNLRSGGSMSNPGTKSLWPKAALRDSVGYDGHEDAMPLEEYVAWQQNVLAECWRIVRPDGAIYYNHKPRIQNKELWLPLECNPGLPLRQIVVWARGSGFNFNATNYLPTHEWLMIFAKPDFKVTDKGCHDVWRIAPELGTEHPAPFPLALAERAISTTASGLVCDPFMGSGTTAVAAKRLGRQFIGAELSAAYIAMAERRLAVVPTPLFDVPRERMVQEAML